MTNTMKPQTFTREELAIGRLLGKGAFATVYSVNFLQDAAAQDGEPVGENSPVMKKRKHNIKSYDTTTKNHQRCAMKTINLPATLSEREDFAKDLLEEARVLQSVPQHKHIIKLVGTSWGLEQETKKSCFLILERLDDTLENRISRWSIKKLKQSRRHSGSGGLQRFLPQQRQERQKELIHDQRSRLETCALGIAKALTHLHEHGVIYRDLKPENCGFDYDGTVKLFDFGLSRSVGADAKDPRRERKLTAMAGTPRYSPPEVWNKHGQYSFSVDVYSYAMVLWEICALERPYAHCTAIDCLRKAIVTKQERPPIKKVASTELRGLIGQCWDQDAKSRPSFVQVHEKMESVLLGQRSTTRTSASQ